MDRTPDSSPDARRRQHNLDQQQPTVGRPFSRPTIKESIERSRPDSIGETDAQRRTRFRPLPTDKGDDAVKGRGRPEIVGSLGPDLGSSADGVDAPQRDRALRRRQQVEAMKADAINSKINGTNVAGVEYTTIKSAGAPFVGKSGGIANSFDGGGPNSSMTPAQAASTTIINDNSVNYITNITYKQNSWGGYNKPHHWNHGWCAPVWGPGSCWNGWDHDGFSFGLGFGGGGFSFSLFYSNGCHPLKTSWCDPWWDGWCNSVVVHCPPRYRWCKPCWSPCGAWYTNYVVYRHVPASWCTPVYAWTPTVAVPAVTTINNNYYYGSTPSVTSTVYVDPQPVTTQVSSLPATSSAEVEAWDLLSNGFPRSSADTFARLHDDNPANSRALVGYAISLAMLEDIPGSATVIRQAIGTDSGLLAAIPMSQQLMERVRLLESSAEVASRQAGMARDSLLLLGAWRAMQGRYTEAHLAILNAQQSGEDSLAAARLRSWLEYRMTPRI